MLQIVTNGYSYVRATELPNIVLPAYPMLVQVSAGIGGDCSVPGAGCWPGCGVFRRTHLSVCARARALGEGEARFHAGLIAAYPFALFFAPSHSRCFC